MIHVVGKVMLEVGGDSWKRKLIVISMDVARNMIGRHRGAITRLAEGTLKGFYRVWCEANQLDLVVQDVLSGFFEE